jgi:hypothetical protein
MLFYCGWANEASLLVDVADQEAAEAAATEEVGSKPDNVRPIPPGVFALRVYFDEDDAEDELVTLEPLPHVVELLDVLEDQVTPDDDASTPPAPLCMSEALDDRDQTVRCELAAGGHVEHRAGDLVWTS